MDDGLNLLEHGDKVWILQCLPGVDEEARLRGQEDGVQGTHQLQHVLQSDDVVDLSVDDVNVLLSGHLLEENARYLYLIQTFFVSFFRESLSFFKLYKKKPAS